jgi:hypothetical protein
MEVRSRWMKIARKHGSEVEGNGIMRMSYTPLALGIWN